MARVICGGSSEGYLASMPHPVRSTLQPQPNVGKIPETTRLHESNDNRKSFKLQATIKDAEYPVKGTPSIVTLETSAYNVNPKSKEYIDNEDYDIDHPDARTPTSRPSGSNCRRVYVIAHSGYEPGSESHLYSWHQQPSLECTRHDLCNVWCKVVCDPSPDYGGRSEDAYMKDHFPAQLELYAILLISLINAVIHEASQLDPSLLVTSLGLFYTKIKSVIGGSIKYVAKNLHMTQKDVYPVVNSLTFRNRSRSSSTINLFRLFQGVLRYMKASCEILPSPASEVIQNIDLRIVNADGNFSIDLSTVRHGPKTDILGQICALPYGKWNSYCQNWYTGQSEIESYQLALVANVLASQSKSDSVASSVMLACSPIFTVGVGLYIHTLTTSPPAKPVAKPRYMVIS
ncbi:hypothetical protein T439DRAFT_337810 [Meredithblackwellia eburnea MCA 4105]